MYRSIGDDAQYLIVNAPPVKQAAPTPDQLLTFAAAGGCTNTLPSEGSGPCLDKNWIPLIAACKFSAQAPAGVQATTWKTFCAKAEQCTWDAVPACPSYDTLLGQSVPACLNADQQKIVSYCDSYPFWDGPNHAANQLCWTAQKSPTWAYNMDAAPACSGVASAGMGLKMGLLGAAVVAGIYLFTRRH